MSRIFGANMFRLRKSRLFHWILVLTAFVTASATLYGCLSIESGDISEYALENYALNGAPFVQITAAAVVIMFLGTDYSQNTIRNKVSVGSLRHKIYAANLLTSAVIGCSINAAWLIGGLMGVPVLGFWKMPLSEAVLYIVISTLCTISACALATIFAMLVRSRSKAAVFTLVTMFALLLGSGQLYNRLNEREEQMCMSVVNGEQTFSLEENPGYVGGAKRAVYELALHGNPLGASIMLSNRDLQNPAADIAGAAFATVFISSLGAAAFRRKDLK